MNTNYPELEDIRDAAIRLHLDGSLHLEYLPLEVLASAYNGTGPEFLPQKIRDLLDGFCRPFLPAVMARLLANPSRHHTNPKLKIITRDSRVIHR